MGRNRIVLIELAVAIYIIFISCKAQDSLVGRWQELGGEKTVEYFSDGTVLFNSDSMSMSGTWKRLEDERVKVDLTVLGTTTIKVIQVTTQEDTVTFTDSEGKAERYCRIIPRSPSVDQENRVVRSFSGKCPGEGGCRFGEWEATDEVTVYRDYSENPSTHFKVKKGEKVEGITSILEVYRLGELLVKEDVEIPEQGIYLQKGETVNTYYYLGEGYFSASVDGEDVEVPGIDCCDEKTKPKTALWLQVRNEAGKIGWTNQVDRFDGIWPFG